ncbi:ACT domain-containing protein [uncultured Maribacter sp.]|uniref:ACT domain-containing protein n=1 Tax=uncultured Maribacter sp. TaxID=431308 RepID=UPI00260D1079|nr:ACT domain-containing protein [uncultured Maribacter sp.]
MAGEANLQELIKGISPKLHDGEYVFCTVKNIDKIPRKDTICEFKEQEGTTIVIEKNKADSLQLKYEFIASWITLTIHSALDAVGLTAAIATELTKHKISCNVVAGYFHDHIFVDVKDAKLAINCLIRMSEI